MKFLAIVLSVISFYACNSLKDKVKDVEVNVSEMPYINMEIPQTSINFPSELSVTDSNPTIYVDNNEDFKLYNTVFDEKPLMTGNLSTLTGRELEYFLKILILDTDTLNIVSENPQFVSCSIFLHEHLDYLFKSELVVRKKITISSIYRSKSGLVKGVGNMSLVNFYMWGDHSSDGLLRIVTSKSDDKIVLFDNSVLAVEDIRLSDAIFKMGSYPLLKNVSKNEISEFVNVSKNANNIMAYSFDATLIHKSMQELKLKSCEIAVKPYLITLSTFPEVKTENTINLINHVENEFIRLRNEYSIEIFGKGFSNLKVKPKRIIILAKFPLGFWYCQNNTPL